MELNAKIPAGPIEQKWTEHKFDMKLVNPANKRKYDVIVVGSGLAGASGAASMAELGYPTISSTMDRIFMAPAGLPPDRLKKLRAAFDELVQQQAVKDYIANLGDEIKYMDGADYDALRPAKYKTFTLLIKEMTGK